MCESITISGRMGYVVLALPYRMYGQELREFVAGVLRGLRATPGMGRYFSWSIRS